MSKTKPYMPNHFTNTPERKGHTKPNPTTVRLYPEDEKRLLEIAKAHNCLNRQCEPSWRVLLDRLRMGAGGTIYVSTTGGSVEKEAEVDETNPD